MSVSLSDIAGQLEGSALSTVFDLFNAIPQGNIGGIAVDVTIEEVSHDQLQVTEHPVQSGANITDHSFLKPPELVMRCGWSNANAAAALSVAQSFFTGDSSASDYVGSIYSQLRALQQSRTLFEVTSTTRTYANMLLTSLSVTRDQKTSQALMVTATMRQVIIVTTQSATLPPIANQENPPDTAEITNLGPQTLIPVSPPPGYS